ncbi:MAG: kelch repeat-containing protein [Candidatus Limnocylindrales bacterium]|jgi:WD40 repeat protein
MTVARAFPTATLLADGRVLIFGGCSCTMAELYEPATGRFVPTGSMGVVRTDGVTATRLQDGRVLVAGGDDASQTPLASAELYDPATGSFSVTGSMTTARWGQTATLLSDGRVLVAGGSDPSGVDLATAELYDPVTGTFSRTGSLTTARGGHTATTLSDGRVLVVGGSAKCLNGNPSGSAEVFDPRTGTFNATGSLVRGRLAQSAIPLSDGGVLVLGGNASCVQEEPLASAELYDPGTGRFVATGSMAVARDAQSATVLADGRVLVVGGADNTAELFDPATGLFTRTGSAIVVRNSASATLLEDGRVLLAGGSDDPSTWASAELYQP